MPSEQPYEEVLVNRPRIVRGSFRCGEVDDDDGLKVEVLTPINMSHYEDERQIRLRIGGEGAKQISVDKRTARILKEFFALVEESF